MCFTNKAIGIILVVLVILNIFSGCTLSKEMRADMGFINNQDTNYSYITEKPNSFFYVNNETGETQEYYGYPDFSINDIDAMDLGFEFSCINSNFAIITYKLDVMQSIHSNKLYKHLADQLIYLNPTNKNTELLFESEACEIIIYGTLEYVLVYNAEYNVYRYVSLLDESIIHEVESNIDPFSGDYGFDIYEKKQIFEVHKNNSVINKITLIDSVYLHPNQYLE